MTKSYVWIAVVLLLSLAPMASADNDPPARPDPPYDALALQDVLEAVSRKTGNTFVVDADAKGTVHAGQLAARDVTMEALHTLLFANGLAAVEKGDLILVLPVTRVRQHPLPLVGESARELAPDEWVTQMVTVDNVPAGSLIPILRPMLPSEGHLAAAKASNTIVIVDRYANAGRIADLIARLDTSDTQD